MRIIIVGDEAYGKIVMHCGKHIEKTVNGVLICKKYEKCELVSFLGQWGIDSVPEQLTQIIYIHNVIPLFHTNILSPQMLLGLTYAECVCEDDEEIRSAAVYDTAKIGPPSSIAGYYHIDGGALYGGQDLAPQCLSTLTALSEKLGPDVIHMSVDTKKLSVDNQDVLTLYTKNANNWTRLPLPFNDPSSRSPVWITPTVIEKIKAQITHGNHLALSDFDDYLSNQNANVMKNCFHTDKNPKIDHHHAGLFREWIQILSKA